MNSRDWNWYYGHPAEAADTIERLHRLLWAIVDDLAERSTKRDRDGTAVLNLGAGIVQRIDDALDGRKRPVVPTSGDGNG